MILVDTSVWIDHLHRRDPSLVHLLETTDVCTHPLVIGELAMGSLRDRNTVLRLLADLPTIPVATQDELLHLVEGHRLHGLGLGVVDAHLLASLRLGGDRLWTRDRRLRTQANALGVAANHLD